MKRLDFAMRRKRSERGYNLVEVLIAMALLATVMLGIFGLFVHGRRQVYAGKQMTQAVAVGTRAMEDLSSLDVPSLLSAFLITSATPVGNVEIDANSALPENDYTNAILRSTLNTAEEAAPPAGPGFLARWRGELEDGEKLANGRVYVVIMPREDATVDDATLFQVRVIVRWVEGARERQAIFDTVKVRRPA